MTLTLGAESEGLYFANTSELPKEVIRLATGNFKELKSKPAVFKKQ